MTMARLALLPEYIRLQESETRPRGHPDLSLPVWILKQESSSEHLGQGKQERGTTGSDPFQPHIPGPGCLADRMRTEGA